MIYFEESNGEVWFRKTAETHPVAIVGERETLVEERVLIELL